MFMSRRAMPCLVLLRQIESDLGMCLIVCRFQKVFMYLNELIFINLCVPEQQ